MAQDIWKAGPETTKIMVDLINQYHPDLAIIQEEIILLFKDKASVSNGVTILGKTKKAPPILPVLTDKKYDYRFIIEIGADQWNGLSDSQRVALIDHHLCSILVEEDAQSGEIKCSIKPPDFTGYKDEVARHGMWRPLDDETLHAVEKMFHDATTGTGPSKRAAGNLESLIDED